MSYIGTARLRSCQRNINDRLAHKNLREIRTKRGKNKISLRYRYKYLSVRSSGIAAFDALMPQEDTTLIVETLNADQIALKSIYNKYLTIQGCNRNEETRKCGCFYDKPTFAASSRGELEVWKIKCKKNTGKCY